MFAPASRLRSECPWREEVGAAVLVAVWWVPVVPLGGVLGLEGWGAGWSEVCVV